MSHDLTAADVQLDELAVAYAADPTTVGRLLASHAARVIALDCAAVRDDATAPELAMYAAEADGTRGALLDEIRGDRLADVIPLAARTPLAQNGHRA